MVITSAGRPIRADVARRASRGLPGRAAGLCLIALTLAACSSPASSAGASATTTQSASISPGTDVVGVSDSWIVYEGPSGAAGDGAGIRMVRPDGTGDHWATPDVPVPSGGWQADPDWSPDGQRIAFAADDGPQSDPSLWTRDLWVSDVNGGQAERVFDCRLPCLEADDPAWSPDGQQLAFVAFDGRGDSFVNVRLAVLDLGTGKVQTLVKAKASELFLHPRWSPDGKTLVLEIQRYTDLGPSGKLLASAIATQPTAGLGARPTAITPWTMWAWYPDWHPTEDLIVFSTRPWSELGTGPSNLYTLRPDGSNLTQITTFAKGETRAAQPSWTPDGQQLIFTAVEGDDVEGDDFGDPTMAVVGLDGSGLAPATSSGAIFGTHARLRPTIG